MPPVVAPDEYSCYVLYANRSRFRAEPCVLCKRPLGYAASFACPRFAKGKTEDEFAGLSGASVHQWCIDSMPTRDLFIAHFNATSTQRLGVNDMGCKCGPHVELSVPLR